MVTRLIVFVVLGLTLGLMRRPALAGARPQWEVTVSLEDLRQGIATIDWTLDKPQGSEQVCADMDGAERYVVDQQVQQVLDQPGRGALRPLPFRGECWQLPDRTTNTGSAGSAGSAGPLRLRYRYNLARLAAENGDPDYASRVGEESYIANDQAFLLRPDPLPKDAEIRVRFQLPSGARAAAPWDSLDDGAGRRFRYDAAQYDAGSYVAIGALRSLGELKLQRGGTAAVWLLPLPDGRRPRARDEELVAWVRQSLDAVANFYQELPGGRLHLVLAPISGSADPGVFGAILRHGRPSAVLYFGADAAGPSFLGHWMAYHELFHLGNPVLERRIPWFVEGFTTYYQVVLRSQDQSRDAAYLWGDLYDGLRRFCDPREGRSLRTESRELRSTHRYTRVYWGGACLAFRVDVAVRQRSQGRRSLDALLRDLRRRSLRAPLTEADVIAALEREAGPGLVREHLDSRGPLPWLPLLRQLGVEPLNEDTVRLYDGPLAAVRKQIMK